MKEQLTSRQKEILAYLKRAQKEYGVMPSTREIQHYFGFASQTAAMSHLRSLEKKGAIQRLPGKARAVIFPEVMERGDLVDIPLYGRIAAGYAQEQEATMPDRVVSLDAQSLGVHGKKGMFALEVQGLSMIDAHILPGDTVILESRMPKRGDIVAALIDGETTLKRYVSEKGNIFLKAENDAFPNLIPACELVIQGVMCGLIRRV